MRPADGSVISFRILVQAIQLIAFVLLATILTGGAYFFAWRRFRRDGSRTDACTTALRQWGLARNLAFSPESMELTGTIEGTGVIIRVSYDEADSGLPYSVTMAAVANDVLAIVLQVAHVGWSRSEKLARHQVSSGDPAFDERFRMWTDTPQFLESLFTDRLKSALMKLDPTEFFYDRGVVEVCWNELFDQVETPLHDLDAAFDVIVAACRH
jgi:hypothetical protein